MKMSGIKGRLLSFRCAAIVLVSATSAILSGTAPAAETASPSAKTVEFEGLATLVRAIPPGSWYELPGSKIPLITAAEAKRIGVHGWTGPVSVITSWNGAAFNGRRWFFHGGGHADYGGNEVYAFDFGTLRWERLTDPSPLTGPFLSEKCRGPESGPPAMHTYDGLIWTPKTNEIFLFGAVPFCTAGMVYEVPGIYAFDPVTKRWRLASSVFKGGFARTALLPNGDIYLHVGRWGRIYDPATGRFVRTASAADAGWAEATAEYYPPANVIYMISGKWGNKVQVRSVSNLDEWKELQSIPSFEAEAPCLAYHPPTQTIAAFDGSRSVWILSPMENNSWRKIAPPVGPTRARGGGMYGKCAYISEVDVFAVYSNPAEGIWLYKPKAISR